MRRLQDLSKKLILDVPEGFTRYLMDQINWENRLIGISGGRGAGKTTLLLQYLKRQHPSAEGVLYISMDDIYFAENTLIEFADQFEKEGGKLLVLDEVHKYKYWSHDLKLIYDRYSGLKVVFTSSSALEIYKGSHDLSRRLLLYHLPGLSLREYALFKYSYELPVLNVTDIFENAGEISMSLPRDIKIIKLFNEYREYGYYPFFIEDLDSYQERLLSTLNVVLESDLPAIYNIDFKSVLNLKKLVSIIARLVPYKPNVRKLADQIGVTWETLLRYLFYLEKAQVVKWLGKDTFGINYLNKPEKLYLQNTNLIYALGEEYANIGAVRETFVLNQLSVNQTVTYPSSGDFLVDGKHTLVIGGKSKTIKQIAGVDNAYLVKDNIEFASKREIPLWMFGLLY